MLIDQIATPLHVLRVLDEEAYRARVIDIAHAAKQPVTVSGTPLTAYVSENRWVADCPRCRSGIALGRTWGYAGCFGCCTSYPTVIWPEDAALIEDVLLARPPENRHWLPVETAEQLVDENRAHGLPDTRSGADVATVAAAMLPQVGEVK